MLHKKVQQQALCSKDGLQPRFWHALPSHHHGNNNMRQPQHLTTCRAACFSSPAMTACLPQGPVPCPAATAGRHPVHSTSYNLQPIHSTSCTLHSSNSINHRLRSWTGPGIGHYSSCRKHLIHSAPIAAAAAAAGDWPDQSISQGAPYSSSLQPMSANNHRAWHAKALSSLVLACAPVIQFVMLYRDILQRVAVTLAMLAVFRAGLFIPLPGVDFSLFPAPPAFSEGERLVRALYGQAHALPASIFELGISPFINASILVTMVMALPQQLVPQSGPLHRIREARKEGRTGQAYITSIINYMALIFAVYWALVKAVELQPYAITGGAGFIPLTAVTLIAGSTIIQYCASIITASGIGNGSSLIICCGIITEYAEALHNVISRLEAGAITVGLLAVLAAAYLLLALAAVYISRTELRLPVMQYNRSSTDPALLNSSGDDGSRSAQDFPSARRAAELLMARRIARADYFPIPINNSGMMSMILAGAFWWFMMPAGAELLGLTAVHAGLLQLQQSWLGLLIYGLLVFAVEFLPLGGINPKDVAEYFNAMNVGIKGVVPGEPTEQHVQAQLLRCKFWGGLALGCLATSAHVFDAACQSILGASLSATSLLIIVGTVLQSSRQVESLLEGPRLNRQLEKEQHLIQSLTSL